MGAGTLAGTEAGALARTVAGAGALLGALLAAGSGTGALAAEGAGAGALDWEAAEAGAGVPDPELVPTAAELVPVPAEVVPAAAEVAVDAAEVTGAAAEVTVPDPEPVGALATEGAGAGALDWEAAGAGAGVPDPELVPAAAELVPAAAEVAVDAAEVTGAAAEVTVPDPLPDPEPVLMAGAVAAFACREDTSRTTRIPAATIATCTARRAMCRKIGCGMSSSRTTGTDRTRFEVPLISDPKHAGEL